MAYGLSVMALSVMGRASPAAGPLSSPSAPPGPPCGTWDGRSTRAGTCRSGRTDVGITRDLSSTVSLEQRTTPHRRPETRPMPRSLRSRAALGGLSTAFLVGLTTVGLTAPATATPEVFRPQLVTVDTPTRADKE